MKKLFHDDLHTIDMVYEVSQEIEFDIARSHKEFVSYIKEHGFLILLALTMTLD